ncbi:hypothetical protein FANTH_14012 [Fusarium anthophilum]|uniref:Xylanolytic transcriptional activator regulatory domain-containing protein n=1 Tax=Fusarium anthophilum TaxID=48485 RepID=A0A8H5DNG5_9HYPO|nr:hypothetical protein FANTH_14012 [Fusarium anthophilum]
MPADNSNQILPSDKEHPVYPRKRRSNGVAQLNQQTGCFEYYGQTSTFSIASHLGKRLRQLEDVPDDDNEIPPATRRREDANYQHQEPRETCCQTLALDELPGFCDYVVPLNAIRSDRYIHEQIANRHMDSFFKTIHFLLPILSPATFKARYNSLRNLFGDRRLSLATLDDPTRPQFVCLMYAVLALGALYEDEREDSSLWASWYFAEAQNMLGHLLNASNLELIQALTLLGAYAQHAIKPNLAYILNGVAARLAFSNGLNVESMHGSLGVSTEVARRTWWIIYIQEVELSLDSGRPMCLGLAEMNMNYPKAQLPEGGSLTPSPDQDMFIPLLAEVTKITNEIMELSVKPTEPTEPTEPSKFKSEQREELLNKLERWRASLPHYLAFQDDNQYIHDNDAETWLYTCLSRQKSSLQIHYYLAIITLLQGSLPKNLSERHAATLVILLKVADDQLRERRCQRQVSEDSTDLQQLDTEAMEDDRRLCSLAVEVFDMIKLKASQRCAEVVRHFLGTWTPEQKTKGQDTYHSSVNGVGEFVTQQMPTTVTYSSLPLECCVIFSHEDERPCLQHDAAKAGPWGAKSIGNGDSSGSTSPHLSLSGLQAELHDAFYNSAADGIYTSHHTSFPGAETFGDYVVSIGMNGTVDGSWGLGDHHPYSAM